MRHRKRLIAFLLFATTISNFNVPAYGDDLSIKILEVPMLNVNTQGLNIGSNGKVDLAFYEPYSVEFSGSSALKYTSCEQLVDGITGLETTWTTAGITNKNSISRSNVLYSIGLTKTGIQCALSRRVRDWWGTDYVFAANEQSTQMAISISLDGVKLAEKTGILRNPNYSPPPPLIAGISRGDNVNGYLQFKLEGNLPKYDSKNPPAIGLCPPGVDLGSECGWGYVDEDGNAVVIANPNSYGKSTSLIVRWQLMNETGNGIRIESKLIGLNVAANVTPIPWEVMSKINQIKINLDLNCGSSALKPGTEVNCKVNPGLFYSRPNFGTFRANLNAKINFNVITKSDNCEEKVIPATFLGNQESIYKIKIPNETTSIVKFKFVPASASWRLSTENLYPGAEPGVVLLGGDPTSFGFSAGTGPNCHNYTNRAARPVAKVPTGKVDKKSNAYKKMLDVGKNFAKVSLANDTGKSQCTSALQSGVIRANGVPKYLGLQTALIQSYLKTPSGFQGCVDGFNR